MTGPVFSRIITDVTMIEWWWLGGGGKRLEAGSPTKRSLHERMTYWRGEVAVEAKKERRIWRRNDRLKLNSDFMHWPQKTAFICVSFLIYNDPSSIKSALILMQRMVLSLGSQKSKLDVYAENAFRLGCYQGICKMELFFVTHVKSNLLVWLGDVTPPC